MTWLELKVPPVVVAALTGLAMKLSAGALDLVPLPSSVERWMALVLLVLGTALPLAGIWSFRRLGTTVDPTRPDQASALVTSGVFRWSRNPIYLGLLLLLGAWAFRISSPLTAIYLIAFVLFMNRFQIHPEERALSQRFGDRFETYRTQTRRWI